MSQMRLMRQMARVTLGNEESISSASYDLPVCTAVRGHTNVGSEDAFVEGWGREDAQRTLLGDAGI